MKESEEKVAEGKMDEDRGENKHFTIKLAQKKYGGLPEERSKERPRVSM